MLGSVAISCHFSSWLFWLFNRARRLKDKTPVMTMLFKKVDPHHRTRCKEHDTVLVIKPENSKVLSFQRMANSCKLDLPVVGTEKSCLYPWFFKMFGHPSGSYWEEKQGSSALWSTGLPHQHLLSPRPASLHWRVRLLDSRSLHPRHLSQWGGLFLQFLPFSHLSFKEDHYYLFVVADTWPHYPCPCYWRGICC